MRDGPLLLKYKICLTNLRRQVDKHFIDQNHMTVEIDILAFGSGILPSSYLPLQAPKFKAPNMAASI
jgi:hypothetical protein